MSLAKTPKLIVLRGPSGSGKSTTARRILRETKRNVIVFEQDLYRKAMTRHDDSFKFRQEMILRNVSFAFKNNYDVILDGIFNNKRHKVFFDEIIRFHSSENYFFYFDIPFDETVRRHATRDKNREFGEESMREWFGASAPIGYSEEVIITADMPETAVLRLIDEQTGIL